MVKSCVRPVVLRVALPMTRLSTSRPATETASQLGGAMPQLEVFRKAMPPTRTAASFAPASGRNSRGGSAITSIDDTGFLVGPDTSHRIGDDSWCRGICGLAIRSRGAGRIRFAAQLVRRPCHFRGPRPAAGPVAPSVSRRRSCGSLAHVHHPLCNSSRDPLRNCVIAVILTTGVFELGIERRAHVSVIVASVPFAVAHLLWRALLLKSRGVVPIP